MSSKITARLFLASALAIILWSAFQRLEREKADRTVEICISWRETGELIEREPSFLGDSPRTAFLNFVERCHIIGVRTITAQEETLENLLDRGKVIFFAPGEIEKMKSVGLGVEDLLKPSLLWVKKDENLPEKISGLLPAGITVRKSGENTVFEYPGGSWDQEKNFNVGLNLTQMETLRAMGFSFAYLVDDKGPFIKHADFASPFLRDAISAKQKGIAFRRKINLQPYENLQSAWIFSTTAPDLSVQELYFVGDVVNSIKKGSARFVLLENQPKAYGQVRELAGAAPQHTLRSHTISIEELKSLPDQAILSRWVRAVKERSCRFLYFHWNPEWNAEHNLTLLRNTALKLKEQGFELGRAEPAASVNLIDLPFKPLRLFLAWCAAAILPLAALKRIKTNLEKPAFTPTVWKTFQVWGKAVLLSVIGGLAISFFLPDGKFVNGLEIFRGVKAALFLPLLFAGGILLSRKQLLDLLERKITVMDLVAVFVVFLSLLLVLQRSGNSSGPASIFEIRLRETLENFLGTRPRFKEFLFGHPCLIAGIFLYRSVPSISAALIWAGVLGLESVVNSFCHLHTPLSVTMLRTFHGFWLGGIFGAGLVSLIKFFLLPKPEEPPLIL